MSNGSDINVGSIEEAIEILRNAIRCNEKQFEELGIHILLQDDEEEAIKIVLGNLEILSDMQRSADRELKRQKQINEEHQKLNGELREKVKELEKENSTLKNFTSSIFNNNIEKDFMPKQKIIDELKRLNAMLGRTTEGRIQKYTVNEIIIRSNTLQELLEGEK